MRAITIPILNNEYKVVVCWGNKKHLREVMLDHHYDEDYHHKSYIEDETTNRRGVTFKQARCYPVIWIDANLPAHDAIGTLSHEAVHAVAYIFNDIEEELHHSEIYAHSVGAIVRETVRAMKLLVPPKKIKTRSVDMSNKLNKETE
jgi:alkyl hydroperoxide reductase subunit AhpC